ncbi:MAG: hypothetical protein HYX76_05670 [Acidobacteria bacterium]|nr:hypothetical protein [Acidobacteriota bacterium]
MPLYLGLTYAAGSAPLLTDPPMRDVATTLRQFANTFPTTSLLLMDRSVPSHLGPAINYRFGRDTLIVFRDVDTMPDALRGLVRIAFARGRQVFVVTKGIGDQGGDSLWRSDLAGFTVAPRGTFPLRYMMLRSTREILPRTVAPIEDLLEVYRILPAGASAAILPTPAKLDVGPLDFGFLLKGFYAREEMPSATARWMQSGAQMALPRLSTSPADHPMLAIRMAAYRPPGIAAPTLRLSVNESPVASIPGVTPGFTVYRFPLSDTIVTTLAREGGVLTFEGESFVPNRAGLGDDPRTLCAAIDWVSVEPGIPPP